MSATEQVRADVTAAMKAGDRPKAGALRLLLAELQKDAKEGKGDEIAVLRRERKRRLESADTYRDAGRADLEATERSEAELIGAYLPEELPDAELNALVVDALAETGATEPRDMGRVIPVVIEKAGGRADGRRVSAAVKAALAADPG